MVLVDYILPEFVSCLIFFVNKMVLVLITNTKNYRAGISTGTITALLLNVILKEEK